VSGLTKIEISSVADINLAIKVSQQSKQLLADDLNIDTSDLTKKSFLIVRAEIQGDTRPRIFDFVELPITNMLSSKFLGNTFLARQNERNRKFVLDQYNILQQSLLVLQSKVCFTNLNWKKQDKLSNSLLFKVIGESLFFSHNCEAIVACSVSPSPKVFTHAITALKYCD
jgi:hypothetical protein